jgi:lipoprotein-anchoring transpeptidase ErfK/SrfK
MLRVLGQVGLVIATGIISAIVCSASSSARETIAYDGKETPGTIVVRTNERKLYYIVKEGQAIRYKVGVGRNGKQWFGTTSIASKHIKPAWAPPPDMRNGRPDFVIPSGAPNNPMGAAALVLADNELALHGTNKESSVGGYVSSGCIRMYNADVMDLYGRVSVGTRVVFTR